MSGPQAHRGTNFLPKHSQLSTPYDQREHLGDRPTSPYTVPAASTNINPSSSSIPAMMNIPSIPQPNSQTSLWNNELERDLATFKEENQFLKKYGNKDRKISTRQT